MGAGSNHHDATDDVKRIGYEALTKGIFKHLLKGLGKLLDTALNAATDTFNALAEKADDPERQQDYFRTMRLLRLLRPDIAHTFNTVLVESLETVGDNVAGSADKIPASNEQAPTDPDHDAVRAVIADIHTRASQIHHKVLLDLGVRIEFIAQHSRIKLNREFIDPKLICEAFRESIEPFHAKLSIQNKLILYQVFDRELIGNIGELYKNINDVLISAGVLPVIPTAQSNRPNPPVENQYFSRNDVLKGLSLLQATNSPTSVYTASQLKTELEKKIDKPNTETATWEISPPDGKTIDLIVLLFDTIVGYCDESGPVKSLLMRLQIPVLKCAMLDADFFTDPHHPSRNLLNSLSGNKLLADSRDDRLVARLESIVDKLIDNFDLDIADFQTALDDLNKLIYEHDVKAVAAKPRAAEQDAKKQARAHVLQELQKQLRGNSFPKGAHKLVFNHWPAVMRKVYIKYGVDSEQWSASVDTLKEVVACLQFNITDKPSINLTALTEKIKTNLLFYKLNRDELNASLDGFKSAHDSIQRDNRPIEQAITGSVLPTAELDEVMSDTQGDDGTEAPEFSQNSLLQKLPENLLPGTWVDLYTGYREPKIRAKLSVVIPQTGTLVFVDSAGFKSAEKEIDGFLIELEEELSTIIVDDSVFDKALSSVIFKLAG